MLHCNPGSTHPYEMCAGETRIPSDMCVGKHASLVRIRTVKNEVSIKLFYYCGVLLVLNYCSNHREIPSAVLILLEKTDFVIHVIDF